MNFKVSRIKIYNNEMRNYEPHQNKNIEDKQCELNVKRFKDRKFRRGIYQLRIPCDWANFGCAYKYSEQESRIEFISAISFFFVCGDK